MSKIVDAADNPFGPTATPIVTSKILIEANGSLLQWVGTKNARAFSVGSTGNLTIENAYIKGFVARGGNGGTSAGPGGPGFGGGGGGMGAGGAIYVHAGSLLLENSTFENNGAIGGNGSTGGDIAAGGGGLGGNGVPDGTLTSCGGGGGGGGSRGDGGLFCGQIRSRLNRPPGGRGRGHETTRVLCAHDPAVA